jgi:hypothetical protein
MSFIPGIFIFLATASLIAGLIISRLRRGVSGIKIMVLGINLTLFGGIIAVDPNSSLGGTEYLIALLGLILSIVGLGKND